MNLVQVKSHYSASELAAMQLACLPTSRDNVRLMAEREAWPFVEKKGRGGTRREFVPPPAVMAAIKAKTGVASAAKNHPAVGTARTIDELPFAVLQLLDGLTVAEARHVLEVAAKMLEQYATVDCGDWGGKS